MTSPRELSRLFQEDIQKQRLGRPVRFLNFENDTVNEYVIMKAVFEIVFLASSVPAKPRPKIHENLENGAVFIFDFFLWKHLVLTSIRNKYINVLGLM